MSRNESYVGASTRFSVIIPAFNEEKSIGPLVKSLVDDLNLEVIVVDNGSTDLTVDVASKFGAEVHVLPSANIAMLRNYGALKASGEYLIFIDADCFVVGDWLEHCESLILGEYSVVSGILVCETEKYWVEKLWIEYLSRKYRDRLTCVETLSSFFFMIGKKDFFEVGGFNEDLVTCEDYDFGIRLTSIGKKIVISREVKVIHYGNAINLYQFFKRQIWQGGSNLFNFFSHRFSINEFPSVLAPAMYFIFMISFIFSLFLRNDIYLFFLVVVAFFPFFISIFKVGFKGGHDDFKYYLIWLMYLLGRGLSSFFPRRLLLLLFR